MAARRRFVLGLNIAGVGKTGDTVEVDPTLWAELIEAGYLVEVDEDGNRMLTLPDGSEV